MSWDDVDDEFTDAVREAHPARGSDSHDQYALALQMVGNRHSKGALVALVSWLLVERDAARAQAEELEAEVLTRDLRIDELEEEIRYAFFRDE